MKTFQIYSKFRKSSINICVFIKLIPK